MEKIGKDLMSMKVPERKAELAAREEPATGAKAWLRQRLHAGTLRTMNNFWGFVRQQECVF